MGSKHFTALTLSAALTAAVATSAIAAPRPVPQAQNLGMALLGAYVLSIGGFDANFSSGVVSANRTALGEYEVKFNRVLSGCTPAAMTAFGTGFVTIAGLRNGDTWLLRVYDPAGASADMSFTIVNFCSK